MSGLLDRRRLVLGAGALGGLGLAGCATRPAAAPVATTPSGLIAAPTLIAPIRADLQRISRVTVCLRPFRKAGPRMDVETVGDKRVVHNYGHGGSGWSLSWGAAEIATRYVLLDAEPGPDVDPINTDPVTFVDYGDRIADLRHRTQPLAPGSHPFPVAHARRGSAMQFNIAAYARLLTAEFLMAGGRIETRAFHTPGDLAPLKQKVVVNCTGYGARALWKDDTVVPVRGQITWLLPQPEVNYGLYYNDVSVVSRHDGLVVQHYAGEMQGYGDDNEAPDRAETETAVKTLADLYARFSAPRA